MTTPHRANLECNRPTPGSVSIRQAAECRLLASGYTALSDVRCDLNERVLRLRGLVSTYHFKQVALAMVADIEGVHLVSNQIEVVAPSWSTRP